MHSNRWREKYGPDVLAIASLLLLVLLRFLPTLVSGRLYAPFGDNVGIYGPMFSETARIALHHEYPFYLPNIGTGFPLYQSPHYCPAYPFYFFGLLDYGGPLQSLHTLTYLAIFHRAILALNFFVMLRCARVSPWASFVGASLGMFVSNSELYSGWITIASSYAWLPLLIAGGVLLIRDPRSLIGTIVLGVSAGLIALASASQSVAHALFCSLVLFASGAIWLFLNGDKRLVLRLAVSLAVAGLIAFGLAAVSAVPVALGIKDMVRHLGNGFVIGHEKIPWEKFNERQMGLGDWPFILLKPGKLEIVGSPYVGPLGVIGVTLTAVFFRRLDPMAKWLVATIGAIGLYGLLSAFGTHLGFAQLNYHVPLFDKIREAGRYLALFVIAVVFLCGIGFDQLGTYFQAKDATPLRTSGKLFLCGIILFFVAVVGWEVVTDTPLKAGGWLMLLLAPTVLLVAFLLRIPKFGASMLVAFPVSLAAAICPVRSFPVETGDYSKKGNLQQLAVMSELQGKIPPTDFRIDFIDPKTSPFSWGMNASYFGYKSFYNRLTPQPYDRFRFSLQHRPYRLREVMGSRYVICASDKQPDDPAAIARFEINGYTVFENPAYMDRVMFVHYLAGSFANQEQLLSELGRKYDFRQGVLIKERDAERLRPFVEALPGKLPPAVNQLKFTRNTTNQVRVVSETVTPGVVILNEWFTPAWQVRVNGKRQAILRANEVQVAVPVRAGHSLVEFSYRPSLAWPLLMLNRITWLALASFIVARLVRSALKQSPTLRAVGK